jgi:cytolysin-activating lysine-acyltransferase
MPYAFVTWARVNDEVHQRLLQGHPKLAPHEWSGGNNLWLIDVVTPFGGTQDVLSEVQNLEFPGQALRYLSRNPETQKNEVFTYEGSGPKAGTSN